MKVETGLVGLMDAAEEVMAEVAGAAAMGGIEGAVMDEEEGMVAATEEAAETEVMIATEGLIETAGQFQSRKGKRSKLLSSPLDEEETESPASTTSWSSFRAPMQERRSRSE